MTTASVYLKFNGNCREAMTFYNECLGGELLLQTVRGTTVEAQYPPDMQHLIMHASLVKEGLAIMADDVTLGAACTPGDNFSLMLNCTTEEEVNEYYHKFSAGGAILVELKTQFWGSLFGEVKDKFGIRWMFTCQPGGNG